MAESSVARWLRGLWRGGKATPPFDGGSYHSNGLFISGGTSGLKLGKNGACVHVARRPHRGRSCRAIIFHTSSCQKSPSP